MRTFLIGNLTSNILRLIIFFKEGEKKSHVKIGMLDLVDGTPDVLSGRSIISNFYIWYLLEMWNVHILFVVFIDFTVSVLGCAPSIVSFVYTLK